MCRLISYGKADESRGSIVFLGYLIPTRTWKGNDNNDAFIISPLCAFKNCFPMAPSYAPKGSIDHGISEMFFGARDLNR